MFLFILPHGAPMDNLIDITDVDLVEVVKAVYDLSKPRGLGFLHFDPTPLSDEEAKRHINMNSRYPIDMDYVRGRACKFYVIRKDDRLFIRKSWECHTLEDTKELLRRIRKI